MNSTSITTNTRKHYLDNIRWITVVIVVFYHVIYMYNAEGILGVVGKITDLDVQYYDVFQYIVYPWFMFLLFMVSGISAKLYLDNHTDKEFVKTRTTRILVPSTVGLFAFQFIQGYFNSYNAVQDPTMPVVAKVFICLAAGIGVLWYLQLLWIYCILLVLVRKIEKDRFRPVCKRVNLPILIVLSVVAYGAGLILNTPIVAVYRIGFYMFAFFMGYFVLSHDEVIEVLKKWFPLFAGVSLILCVAFCYVNFGGDYADAPTNRTPLFAFFGYFASLAIIGGMAKYANFSNGFTKWMSKRSFGLYVFHYLGISIVAHYLGRTRALPAPAIYLISLVFAFVFGYVMNAIISRIPFFRWAVLGISKKRSK